jgi:predicted MFS family arabinose efflux permease
MTPIDNTNSINISSYRESFLHIRSYPQSFWILISATIMNQIGNMAFVFIILYLSQMLGFSLIQATLAFVVFSLGMIMIGLIGGPLINRMGASNTLIASLLLNGFALLALSIIKNYYFILLICLVWGLAFGMGRPSSQTFVANLSLPGSSKIYFSVLTLSLIFWQALF